MADSITECFFLTLDKIKLYPMLVINIHYKNIIKVWPFKYLPTPNSQNHLNLFNKLFNKLKIISTLLNNIDEARVLSKCKICLLSNKFLSNTIMKNILKKKSYKITGTNVIKISVISIYFPEYEILQIFITSIIWNISQV